MHTFVRSAIMLSACTLGVALLLAPFAYGRVGSSGPLGLLAAAAICLVSALLADGCGIAVARISPVGAVLVGMFVRMFLPLSVCVAILAAGESGSDHLAFIGYLLTFYMVTLCLETWLAVKRSSDQISASSCSAN